MPRQNDNSGALFKNDRKDSPKQPDYKGSAQIDGRDYWLSAWIKQGKQQKFMSLAFTLKDVERSSRDTGQREQRDDIPF